MGTAGALAHRGLALACLGLAFVGWAIFLGAVGSLQQACPGYQGGQALTDVLAYPGGLGSPGYLAPVKCNKLFSYPWWIWAFFTFMLVVLALGSTTFLGRMRGMMVALSAVLLVLLMNTANTFLYVNYIDGLPSTIAARGRVLAAGAIIASIALFLLIMVLGWHNEDAAVEEHYDAEATGKKKGRKTAAGGGGVLGKLGLKKGRGEGAEEEAPGAGTAGSPRYIQVSSPTAGAMPAGGLAPTGTAGPGPGTIIPGPISSHGPAYVGGGGATTVTTTTVAPAVPVSTQAATFS